MFIIGLIGYHPDTRISLYVGCAWIVLLLVGWCLNAAATVSWRKRSNIYALSLWEREFCLLLLSPPSIIANVMSYPTTLWQGDVNFIKGDS